MTKAPPRPVLTAVSALRPHPDNPRSHSAAQIDELAHAVRRFGFQSAVLASSDGHILAGHARVEAARKAGLEEVPVITVRGLTRESERLLIISDNSIHDKSADDDKKLAEQIQKLVNSKTSLEGVGIDDNAVKKLLDTLAPVDDSAESEAAGLPDRIGDDPRTETGDLWRLGDHLLAVGDSATDEPWNILRAAGASQFAAMVTDMPGSLLRAKSGRVDTAASARLQQLWTETLVRARPVLAGSFYLGHSLGLAPLLLAVLAATDHFPRQTVIWVKQDAERDKLRYHTQHRCIIYGNPAGVTRPYFARGQIQTSVWYGAAARKRKGFPTPRSRSVAERALRHSCPREGTALDPFAGDGAAFVAATRAGVRLAGIEGDPLVADYAVRAWQGATGGAAYNDKTGEAFGD